jgi:hypothetical protein
VLFPAINAVEISNGSAVMLELQDNELVTTVLLERLVLEAIGGVFETRMLNEELDGCKAEGVVASDTVLVMTGPVNTYEIFGRVVNSKVLDEGIGDVDNVELEVFKIEDVVASNTVLVTTGRVTVLNAIDRVLDSRALGEGKDDVATVKLATVKLVTEDELRVLDGNIKEESEAVELAEGVDHSLRPDEETTEPLNSVGESLLVNEEIETRAPEDSAVFTSSAETSEETGRARRD